MKQLYITEDFKYAGRMEAVIDMPVLELPNFVDAVRDFADATIHSFAVVHTRERNKWKLRKPLDRYFPALDDFLALVPRIMTELDIQPQNSAQAQKALVYCTGLRKVLCMIEGMLLTFKGRRSRLLNSRQFEKLREAKKSFTKYVHEADEKVFRMANTASVAPALKDHIGEVELAAPLRVFIEDDDTGKHVSCLEFPMLYGFGETETEAMEMLDREIVSLCNDVEDYPDLPDEYMYAALLANMVWMTCLRARLPWKTISPY